MKIKKDTNTKKQNENEKVIECSYYFV